MIISRTPFRISLVGGGSDLPEYYRRRQGRVVSMSINRYMYVTVNRRFEDTIRVSYTRTEIVDHLDDLRHDLIRECLRMVGITRGVEVTTIADLPAGIGLGSSSSLTVGTLHALYALKGEWHSAETLARRACEIEIAILRHPIGKQDQYIAAFGGLCDITFRPDDSVAVHPLACAHAARERLLAHLLLFFTGRTRNANEILDEARQRLVDRPDSPIDALVTLADDLRAAVSAGDVDRVGEILHASWELKKQMASTVSNAWIDDLYDRARRAGAVGGKVSGAGGGGCLLLFVPPERQPDVRQAMDQAGAKEVGVTLEPDGSRIIFSVG